MRFASFFKCKNSAQISFWKEVFHLSKFRKKVVISKYTPIILFLLLITSYRWLIDDRFFVSWWLSRCHLVETDGSKYIFQIYLKNWTKCQKNLIKQFLWERRRTSRNSDWFTPTLNNSSRNTFGRLDFWKQTNFRLVRPDFDFLNLERMNFTFQLENSLKFRMMLLKATLIFRFNISKW